MSREIDETGNVYGDLVVLARSGTVCSSGYIMWSCRCSCGQESVRVGAGLRAGSSKTCGKCPVDLSSKVMRIYIRSARSRRKPWSITKDLFLSTIAQPCVYCDDALGHCIADRRTRTSRFSVWVDNPPFYYTGIDCIDPQLGYVDGNIQPCCATCNYAKLAMSEEEFLSWIDRVHRHRGLGIAA